MSLAQIAEGLENGSIKCYRHNPKQSSKAIHSLLERPFVALALAGSIFYRQPGGTYIIVDSNTRYSNLALRSDWEEIKHTEVNIEITEDWEEAKQVVNIKQKYVRGRAPNSELALNVDFPCGKFITKIKKEIRDRLGDDGERVYPHIDKAPQHLFDCIAHLKHNDFVANVGEFNIVRAHASSTSALVNAGPEEHYSKYITPEEEAMITDALEAYALLLTAHLPKLKQNPTLDKLLGVGSKRLNPGFFVAFLLDHMARGQGSFNGFSLQGPRRLLQHIRRGGAASELWRSCAELLRSQPGVPRMETVKMVNRYAL